jgi:hypothetical protein
MAEKKSKKPEIKLSPIMRRVQAHYTDQEIRTLEVPEWSDEEGNPQIIYCTPMTLKEKNLILKGAYNDSDMGMYVSALIRKALDEQGQTLFSIADRNVLMSGSDGDVIESVALWIIGGNQEEEDAGND